MGQAMKGPLPVADETIVQKDSIDPTRYKVIKRTFDYIEWNFTRDQLVAKVAELQTELDRWKAYLTDIDAGKIT